MKGSKFKDKINPEKMTRFKDLLNVKLRGEFLLVEVDFSIKI